MNTALPTFQVVSLERDLRAVSSASFYSREDKLWALSTDKAIKIYIPKPLLLICDAPAISRVVHSSNVSRSPSFSTLVSSLQVQQQGQRAVQFRPCTFSFTVDVHLVSGSGE